MNLPKKIKVLSVDYTIETATEREKGENGFLGNCSCDKNMIKIRKDVTPQKQTALLIHELMHAIFFEMGMWPVGKDPLEKFEISEETMVTTFSNGLAAVIRDNPGLMPAIQKGLK